MRLITIMALLLPAIVYGDTTTFVCTNPTFSASGGIHKTKEKFELTFIVDNDSNKQYVIAKPVQCVCCWI
jgi:hypothetical protein